MKILKSFDTTNFRFTHFINQEGTECKRVRTSLSRDGVNPTFTFDILASEHYLGVVFTVEEKTFFDNSKVPCELNGRLIRTTPCANDAGKQSYFTNYDDKATVVEVLHEVASSSNLNYTVYDLGLGIPMMNYPLNLSGAKEYILEVISWNEIPRKNVGNKNTSKSGIFGKLNKLFS